MTGWFKGKDTEERRNKRSIYLLLVAMAATMAAMVYFAPEAKGSDLATIVDDVPVTPSNVREDRFLGPCYYMTEEVDWTGAPRGKEPYNGDRYALDIQIQFAHKPKDVEALYDKIIGDKDYTPGALKGFAYQKKSTPGVCYIVTIMPTSVDGHEMCTLGHELMHCVAGKYHRE